MQFGLSCSPFFFPLFGRLYGNRALLTGRVDRRLLRPNTEKSPQLLMRAKHAGKTLWKDQRQEGMRVLSCGHVTTDQSGFSVWVCVETVVINTWSVFDENVKNYTFHPPSPSLLLPVSFSPTFVLSFLFSSFSFFVSSFLPFFISCLFVPLHSLVPCFLSSSPCVLPCLLWLLYPSLLPFVSFFISCFLIFSCFLPCSLLSSPSSAPIFLLSLFTFFVLLFYGLVSLCLSFWSSLPLFTFIASISLSSFPSTVFVSSPLCKGFDLVGGPVDLIEGAGCSGFLQQSEARWRSRVGLQQEGGGISRPAAELMQEAGWVIWLQVAVQLRWVFLQSSQSWSLQTRSLDAQRKSLTSIQEIISLISFFVGELYLPTW